MHGADQSRDAGVGRRLVRRHTAVSKDRDVIADVKGLFEAMGDEDHAAAPTRCLADQLEQDRDVVGWQRDRRLIEQEDLPLGSAGLDLTERSGDRDDRPLCRLQRLYPTIEIK